MESTLIIQAIYGSAEAKISVFEDLRVRFCELVQTILWDREIAKEISDKAIDRASAEFYDYAEMYIKDFTAKRNNVSFNDWSRKYINLEINSHFVKIISLARANKKSETDLLDKLQKHLRYIMKYDHRYRNISDDDAQDIVAEALITIYQKYAAAEPQGTFIQWVRKILRNKIGDYLRRQKRKPEALLEGIIPKDTPDGETVEGLILSKVTLLEAVRRMDKRCKRFFEILMDSGGGNSRIYEEFPHLTPEAIHTNLSRCRNKLKQYLKTESFLL